MIHSDLFPHNFSCVKLVCPYWRITPGHQRSWWWRLFWFDGQTRWNWSCCYCHWCSHFLRKGCTPCWLHEPSWPFPEGKIDSSISYACILDRIVNVTIAYICYLIGAGLDVYWELLYMLNCCGNVCWDHCHVSYPEQGVPPWDRQSPRPSHWRHPHSHADSLICNYGYWVSPFVSTGLLMGHHICCCSIFLWVVISSHFTFFNLCWYNIN